MAELTKDAAQDFVKDFFKDALKHVLLREKNPGTVASGKAIKDFLQLVQQELKFRKYPGSKVWFTQLIVFTSFLTVQKVSQG